jgi:predicted negative regulator of RcsB-dependent stress response
VEDLSEKEQLELIRNWWKENGKFIVSGVVIGAAGLFGWNQWQAGQQRTSTEASALFDELVEAQSQDDIRQAASLYQALTADYAATPYATQGALAIAKMHSSRGETDEAIAIYRGIVAEEGGSPEGLIARLREAELLTYADRPAEAVAVLSGVDPGTYAPLFVEARAEAELAQGNVEAARRLYLEAIAAPGEPPLVDVAMLQIKLNALPAEPESVADGATTDDS